MTKEVDDHSRVPLQAAEAAAGEACQLIDCGWQSILHVVLDPSVALFLRIELRRIGRQESHGKLVRVRGEKVFRGPRAMGLQPIPDNQQSRPEAAAKVAQCIDHDGTGDRAPDMPGGQSAIRCDADDARHFSALADTPQLRRMPAARPSQPRPGAEGVPCLIDQDNGKTLFERLFLSATHSCVGQRAITYSSRSRARVAGRCTEKPCAFNGRSR